MLESALGGSICVELATLENFTYPGDLFPSSRFYRRDLSQPPLELAEGCVFKPSTGDLPTPDAELLGGADLAPEDGHAGHCARERLTEPGNILALLFGVSASLKMRETCLTLQKMAANNPT